MRRAARLLWIGALALLPVAAHGGDATPGEPADTSDIMSDIVGALQIALPPSLDAERFDDPAQRARISQALAALAADAARLDAHGETGDAGFAFLSHSLASDAREVQRRFDAGRPEEARFLLHHVIDVCVACHSTLPDEQEHTLGRRLMADAAVADLPVDERLQFELATRQFDAAAASFEVLFADPSSPPADLDLSGFFETYLELCLRVREDPGRALATLEKVAGRPDVSPRMRANLASWIASLGELGDVPRDASLAAGRELLARAADRSRFASDREALVLYVEASALLHRLVAADELAPAERGEAYYLLGVVESKIGRSFWTSQTEDFLAAAIRAGPGEPYAEPAYALLEEFVVGSYTGSAGENVPPDARQQLDELRATIDAATAAPTP